MKCKDILVFRYIIGSCSRTFKEGEQIMMPPKRIFTNGTPKDNIERIFEETRVKISPNALSREDALFVIPYCDFLVDNWIRTIRPRENVSYCLLTLKLNGILEWHNADFFNIAGAKKCCTDEKIVQALKYWLNMPYQTQNPDDILIEGLFKGDAQIVKVEIRQHSEKR